jgi:Tol biopolymer transport system component
MVLEDAEQGTVSPDGLQILFFREDVDLRQPWLANANGRNPHRLAAHRPEHSGKTTTAWSATWSPDGRRIAYIERQSIPSFGPIREENFPYTSDGHIGGLHFVDAVTKLGSDEAVAVLTPGVSGPDSGLLFDGSNRECCQSRGVNPHVPRPRSPLLTSYISCWGFNVSIPPQRASGLVLPHG